MKNIIQEIQSVLGVDDLILAGQSQIISKNKSIATFGLAGCFCVVAEKADTILFGHFLPTNEEQMIREIRRFVPEKTTIFSAGIFHEINGKWVEKLNIYSGLKASYVYYDMFSSSHENWEHGIKESSVSWKNGKIESRFLLNNKGIFTHET